MSLAAPMSLRPVSRWRVIASAAVIVAGLTVLLPLLNPALEARAVAFVGWFPALLTAHVGWALRVGAIRRRFVQWGFAREGRDDAFAIALINPLVLRVDERRSEFRSYLLVESGIALLAWIVVVGPALAPLARALSG
ncbi:MAG: hypothetical protein IT353_17505 [Gemmatimonadaceae bacterium]|nr:hypothetical protein [Gemmatimonadaceae bacterium]